VIRFEWLALLIIAPFLMFPTPVRSLALLGVPFLWTARKISRARFIDRTPLDWPISLLLLMALVSLYATYSIEESLPKIAGVILGVAVFYALVHHTRRIRPWLLGLSLFICAGGGVAALALVGSIRLDKFPPLTALSARLPSTRIFPARIKACAFWRDSANPRSISKTSKRIFGMCLFYCEW